MNAEICIGIVDDRVPLPGGEWQSFSERWRQRAKQKGVNARNIDVDDPWFADRIKALDGLMWRFSISATEAEFVRRLLNLAELERRIPVYPNLPTRWHYDDKVAQKYLFDLLGIQSPKTWVFWSRAEAEQFLEEAEFPLVLKLAGGASSANVALVHNFKEASRWAELLFGRGVCRLADQGRLAASPLKVRLKQALNLLVTRELPDPGSQWRLHKNYMYLQEFIPGNAGDIRITVIGNRAFAFRRLNRMGDFRASGSGLIDYDRASIPEQAVRLGVDLARRTGSQSLAVDIVVQQDQFLVLEVSYAFALAPITQCPGHWRVRGGAGDLEWVDERVNPADAIWDDFESSVRMWKSSAEESPHYPHEG